MDLYFWSLDYDWVSICKQLLAAAASLNIITLVAIVAGLILVKKWVKVTFEGERRWRCSLEG